LGSGVTTHNAVELLDAADGAIVGSYFKMNGNWKNELDPQRVNHFMREVEKLRKR
jgi:predicted TIM-barrel enzyme